MQVSDKVALIIYFIITPILAITGYMYQTLLMFYFVVLGIISILMTIFEEFE